MWVVSVVFGDADEGVFRSVEVESIIICFAGNDCDSTVSLSSKAVEYPVNLVEVANSVPSLPCVDCV